MKKSAKRALIIVLAMMCCLLITVPVSAAKKPSKKTVAKAYEKLTEILYAVGELTNTDMNDIVEELDSIANQDM